MTRARSHRPSRRQFIKVLGGATAGLFLPWQGAYRVVQAAIPGGTLNPYAIPKYREELLIPPAMPRASLDASVHSYEIAVRQISQQILPKGYPETTVWGYGPAVSGLEDEDFHAPSLTIEATQGTPVRVKWINELVDEQNKYLPHLLPVDPTLHWANPGGGEIDRDRRPVFDSTPSRYTGPVPMVPHLHGSVGVGDESDGYAEAWYLPAATNIPAGFATVGTWYDFFRAKFFAQYDVAWDKDKGSATFQYPNTQRASTLWYHDHTLGMTRLNVYAGPAGFFIIRGGPDDVVIDSRSSPPAPAVLPGPAPALGDAEGMRYYEIPIAIQDRSFRSDGSLFYPDSRAFFDGIEGPYIPETDVSPIWNPEFFGDCIMVNGRTWPYLQVEQRRYRFRVLNGCDARFLVLDFGRIPGVGVWMIGNEGGFLPAPFDVSRDNGNRLLLAPAERADLIVDFTRVPKGSFVLRNLGPDEPFGGGAPPKDFDAAHPASTGQIMRFDVGAAVGIDPSTPPQFLQLPAIEPLPADPVTTRPLALVEEMSMHFDDAPVAAMLGTVAFGVGETGTWTARAWADPITENPALGDTEVWELYNGTADAHPMHIHEVTFEVLNRQAIVVDEENGSVQLAPDSEPRPPEPWELGRKDTVIAYPGEVTRVKMTFGSAGQYVWHCHIVEHEDNEMMRPYRIGPVQAGEPGSV